MTDEQIKHMVERFLYWRLPKPFNPDNGIIFTPPEPINAGTPYENDLWPVGTNLFDYTQVEAMVRHMVEGLSGPNNPMTDERENKMDRPETIALLRRAHDEIISLRRERDALAPKAHAYDTLGIIARLSQTELSQGYSEDVAWRLKQAVDQLVAEREAERGDTNG